MYLLSALRSGNINTVSDDFVPSSVKPHDPKFTFTSNKKKTHYGNSIFENLNWLIPGVWEQAPIGYTADINNTNSGNVVWRLDGIDQMTVKHKLPTVSSHTISDIFDIMSDGDDDISGINPAEMLWIQKPSHPYIGSGHLITIDYDLQRLIRSRPSEYYVTPILSVPIDNWVIQPLLPTKLWKGRKFDCRFYSVIYAYNNRTKYYSFPYGIGRICVNRYDPLNDVNSAITNVAIQEHIPGYSFENHMPLLKDDLNLVNDMMDEMVVKLKLRTDDNKLHMIILGLDILFLSDGTPKLIEVNHEPSLEIFKKNNEMVCSLELIRFVFGLIIPQFFNKIRDKDKDKTKKQR